MAERIVAKAGDRHDLEAILDDQGVTVSIRYHDWGKHGPKNNYGGSNGRLFGSFV